MPRIFTCAKPSGQSASIDLDRIEYMLITDPVAGATFDHLAVMQSGQRILLDPVEYADILKAWKGETPPVPGKSYWTWDELKEARLTELALVRSNLDATDISLDCAIIQRMDYIRAGKA